MKISIRNFGPIHTLDFDLKKDLHIFFGKNNTGKSYAAKFIYLLFKTLVTESKHLRKYLFALMELRPTQLAKITEDIGSMLERNDTEEVEITDKIAKIINGVLNDLLVPVLQQSLNNTFTGNIQNLLSKEAFHISLSFSKLFYSIKLEHEHAYFISDVELTTTQYMVKFLNHNKSIEAKNSMVSIYVHTSKFDEEKAKEDIISASLAVLQRMFQEVVQEIGNAYFIPASRVGLYKTMNVFSSVFAKFAQIPQLSGTPISIPALTEPISDYFINLSSIQMDNQNNQLSRVASKIEKEIIKAEIVFNKDTKQLECFHKKLGLRFKFHETASMIGEISPIVAFLKYLLHEEKEQQQLDIFNVSEQGVDKITENKNLLIIEEPETHLHPDSRKRFILILAQLTQLNVKLIVTTHSEVMWETIQHAVASGQLPSKHFAAYDLQHTPLGSKVKEKTLIDKKKKSPDTNTMKLFEL